MCGDVAQGMELAIGTAAPVTADRRNVEQEFLAALEGFQPSPAELAEADRREAARAKRIRRIPLRRMAMAYAMRSHRWLTRHDHLTASADAVLAEALNVITYDASLIAAKLHRALLGRDGYLFDGEDDEGAVQNDWNGSAKVARMSIERSEAAWRAIAGAGIDREAALVANALTALRAAVDREFPDAMAFVRPGFDEPWR